MNKEELKKIEPECKCESALYIQKDASTDYSLYTNTIMQDSKRNNTKFLVNTRVTKIKKSETGWTITLNKKDEIHTKFMINAAGGEAINIAHELNTAKNLKDVQFSGKYQKITKE